MKEKLIGALHSKSVWLAFIGLVYVALETFQPMILGWIPLAFKPVVASAYFLAMVYVRVLTTESIEEKGRKIVNEREKSKAPKVDDSVLKDF